MHTRFAHSPSLPLSRTPLLRLTHTHTHTLQFAACISTLNYDLANDVGDLGPRIFHFILLFQPFWWSYYSNGIIYINRFTTEDYLHHAFMLAQALLSIGMATNVVTCDHVVITNIIVNNVSKNTNATVCVNVIASPKDEQAFFNFCMYTAFLQVAIALQYVVLKRETRGERWPSAVWLCSCV